MAEITIDTGEGQRERYLLAKDRVTIGRSRESDIFLPDQWLSRHHAEIRRRDEGFFVHDLGSKNGTLHNGEPVTGDRRLRHGDTIRLGEHVLTFSETEAVEEDYVPPEGTRIFSARELSDIKTKPSIDPEELLRQNRVLELLTRAAKELLAHRPLPELFEKILDLLFSSVLTERAAILLLDQGVPVIKASRARPGQSPPASVSRAIARRVLDRRETLLVPNLMEDASFSTSDSILSSGIRSALCAPLWFTASHGAEQDAVIGLVYLDSLAQARAFTDEDAHIVTALANVAASKIENVRLLEESLEKRRLEEDMRVAAEIQRGLLPNGSPVVPGYEVVGSNRPCRTVGGDYYDFGLDRDRVLLALGDVSGKGTGAALLMTVLRASVRAHWMGDSPSESVGRINATVCQNVTAGKYVTFFIARLEPASGRLCYVNAGHNPPLLVKTDGRVLTLTEGGMVLGLFDSVPFDEGAAHMERGDVLVIFSDGVTETFDPTGDDFGEMRLGDLISRERHHGAAEIEKAILKGLDAFAAGAKATDDRTLIVVKRN